MKKSAQHCWFNRLLAPFVLLLLLFSQATLAAPNVRYQKNIQGGATMIGNSFYLKTTDWDTAYPIVRADIDGDGSTVISSSADLQLPPGAIVEKAFLSAETMYGIAGGIDEFTSLKLKVPGGSYTTLTTASTGYLTRNRYNDGAGNGRNYRQIVFDVTSYLPSNPIGTYTVADPLPNSSDIQNQMGGWSLIVVYRNPSPTALFRNVTVADNWNFFNTSGEVVNVDIPNVTVPSSGNVKAVIGMTGTYGDPTLTDYIRIGLSSGTLYNLTDPTTGLANDALGGSIGWASTNNVSADGGAAVSGDFTARNPNTGFSTNYSNYYATSVTSAMYDADIFDASNKLPNSSTPITVRVQQNSDGGDWLISGSYFVSVDVPSASLTKTMSPTSISGGTKTTYTFTITNTAVGSVNLTGLEFIDSLPSALKVATPNGLTTTCSGATISAPADGSTVTVSGVSLNTGQTCSVTIDAVAKDGQFNASCATNPAAFTNGSSNITTLDGLLRNSVTAQCLIVTPLDYGDAPATYGTPSHGIVAGLQLGATAPDSETAAQPSTAANLDDTTGTDDEDAITSFPTLTAGATTYSLSNIPLTNTTGSAATLYGWIDVNLNGQFDGNEVASVAVANNATKATLTWPALTGITTGASYVRLRLTTDALTNTNSSTLTSQDTRSTGAALDGEAEDYTLPIAVAIGNAVSGMVFEDINYGGGAGRSQTASAGMGVNGVTVELYSSTGGLLQTTVTANDGTKDGVYHFNTVLDGDYFVRVVNDTVSSTRSGANGSELGVQTFRTDGTTPVTNEVGGADPAAVDGTVNSGSETVNLETLTLSGGGKVQSLQVITVESAAVAGVDFGFNFDTIVNTNDAGQGSLRQFILNANRLGNTGLDQALASALDSDYTIGDEVSVFMIPATALSGSVATVIPQTPLPNATDARTHLDGRTQTRNIADSNTGTFGNDEVVGIDRLVMNPINRPEVWLNCSSIPDAAGADYCLMIAATNNSVRGMGFYGSLTGTFADPSAALYIESGGTAIVTGNAFGSLPDGSEPAWANQNRRMGLLVEGQTSVTNNYFAYNGYGTVFNAASSSSSVFTGNYMEHNGPNVAYGVVAGAADGDSVAVWDGSSVLIEGNYIADSRQQSTAAMDLGKLVEVSNAQATIRNNTLLNGYTANIGVHNGALATTISNNIISGATGTGSGQTGPGIIVNPAGSVPAAVTISHNSIYGNHGLGIDLDNTAWNNGDGVTLNDANDVDTGPNARLNFPQFSQVVMSGGQLLISGCAPAGSTIELFEADVSPTSTSGVIAGANQFGKTQDYGEGERYLGSLVEGVGEDTTSTPVNCATLVDADGNNATGMSPFQWTMPLPSELVSGDKLTATATKSGVGTSEFSPITTLLMENYDYGDAPSDLSSTDPTLINIYNVLDADGAAKHTINPAVHMGASIDAETDGQPNAAASGDGSDDDGVTFPAFPDGKSVLYVEQANTLTVNVSTAGYLNAWIDWNENGVWDASDNIASDKAVVAGNNTLTVTLPNTTTQGSKYARFRFCTTAGQCSSASGLASDGEVEDYKIDYVTLRDNGSCSALLNGDFEQGATATNGVYDENTIPYWGTTPDMPSSGTFAQRNGIEIWKNGFLSTPSQSGSFLAEINAYVNGTLYQDVALTPGTTVSWSLWHRGRAGVDSMNVLIGTPNDVQQRLASTVQALISDDNTQWVFYSGTYQVPVGQYVTRFGFHSISTSGGNAAVGNLVDNISLGVTCRDYGDAPAQYPTTNANNGAYHQLSDTQALYIGSTPDKELEGMPGNTASGDDTSGSDDEDGVSTLPTLTTNDSSYSLSVKVTNTSTKIANLVGWIDFNRNNSFDSNEAATTTVAAGASNSNVRLAWTGLSGGVVGDSYLRLRLTTDTNVATGNASTSFPTGVAGDGEIEDYLLDIAQSGYKISGRVFNDANVNTLDNTEQGIKAVTVVLQDVAAGTCLSTKTGADGSYTFSSVQPAAANNYVLYEAANEKTATPDACPPAANDPNGYLSTTPNSLTVTVSNADVTGQNFGDIKKPTLTLDNETVILPNTSVVYPHIFRSTADGSVAFNLVNEIAEPAGSSWGSTLYLDANCNAKLDSSDTPITAPLSVSGTEKTCLLVKVIAPANVSAGASHSIQVQSTFTFGDGTVVTAADVQTRTDLTRVASGSATSPLSGEGKLSLEKSVWNTTRNIDGAVALPGETLRYTIHYENIGDGTLDELAVHDSVPAFTTLVDGSLQCVSTPTELSACSPSSSAGSLDWSFTGKLQAGSQGAVAYDVMVE